ncbi:MAG: hypothetical protein SWK76_05400 [Actinomycetota bacterium]|nr:hypothetical protein [Actinomycetota bacterium]
MITHIFRKDMQTGEVDLCSCAVSGIPADRTCDSPSISADGRYVAFSSTSTNLDPAVTSHNQVFRKDMQTGEIDLCSCTASGTPGDGDSNSPSISADGMYVAFRSDVHNLYVPELPLHSPQILRKNCITGKIVVCSSLESGREFNSPCYAPSINADGRYVAFHENMGNVYWKDLQTGELAMASSYGSDVSTDGYCIYPSISADGRYVAFEASGSDLNPEGSLIHRIFRKDLETGEIKLCSSDVSWNAGNLSSRYPSISSDGRYVAFQSGASNLIPGVTSTYAQA